MISQDCQVICKWNKRVKINIYLPNNIKSEVRQIRQHG